jgi:hypothetical protein
MILKALKIREGPKIRRHDANYMLTDYFIIILQNNTLDMVFLEERSTHGKESNSGPSMVVRAYNPSYSTGIDRRITV